MGSRDDALPRWRMWKVACKLDFLPQRCLTVGGGRDVSTSRRERQRVLRQLQGKKRNISQATAVTPYLHSRRGDSIHDELEPTSENLSKSQGFCCVCVCTTRDRGVVVLDNGVTAEAINDNKHKPREACRKAGYA